MEDTTGFLRFYMYICSMAQIPLDIEKKLKAVIRRIEQAAAFDGVWNDNFDDSTSIKSLAKVAGMSERSLRDWFKVYTGRKISHYASKRRAEYAARLFKLFPDTTKSDVSHMIGLSSTQSLYPFMRRNGVTDMNALGKSHSPNSTVKLRFRLDILPESVMFYMQDDVHYGECAAVDFETEKWDTIEAFINRRFPTAVKIGDVGYAIDRYVEGDTEKGVFISGILYKDIDANQLVPDMTGDIGWRFVACRKYAVFTHKGGYDGLSETYSASLQTLRQEGIQVDKSRLIMERYVNSPMDSPVGDLITEIWVPIQ